MEKQKQPDGKVIILNKPFLGGWLNKEGNIGHEVINFIKTDDGQYYVYNNPWGVCPKDIFVEGDTREKDEKYAAKYMVLTGPTKKVKGKGGASDKYVFDILYVIELAKKLHRCHHKRIQKEYRDENDEKKWTYEPDVEDLIVQQSAVQKEITDTWNIKYNNVFLHQIYGNDETFYVTFEGKKIYKAEKPIPVELKYNFQRNKGYLYNNKEFKDDYDDLEKLLDNETKTGGRLKEYALPRINQSTTKFTGKKTFLDLIGVTDSEQVYTNMLYHLLQHGELFKRFCTFFKECWETEAKATIDFDSDGTFEIFRESRIVNGRMDVCATSSRQRIIIENKVYSGLNGINPEDKTSQLSNYYEWGKCDESKKVEMALEPLCFITAPNFRKGVIEREIEEFDSPMCGKYYIITYGKIADFLRRERSLLDNFAYTNLVEQIIAAFDNLSYSTNEELYATMFYQATQSKKSNGSD